MGASDVVISPDRVSDRISTLSLAGRKHQLANCVVIIGSDCAQDTGTREPKHIDVFFPCARGIWPPSGASWQRLAERLLRRSEERSKVTDGSHVAEIGPQSR